MSITFDERLVGAVFVSSLTTPPLEEQAQNLSLSSHLSSTVQKDEIFKFSVRSIQNSPTRKSSLNCKFFLHISVPTKEYQPKSIYRSCAGSHFYETYDTY